jgi:hypothetical protein
VQFLLFENDEVVSNIVRWCPLAPDRSNIYPGGMLLDRLNEILKAHKQFENKDTCSASAHEFIGKLYGKVGDDEFPLQSDPASEHCGFEFEEFLNSIDLHGKDWGLTLTPQEALEKLTEETQAGRYPLVSAYAGSSPGKHYAHILVAFPKGGEVALIDPALHVFTTDNAAETMELLTLSAAAPGRGGKVHFLTYL